MTPSTIFQWITLLFICSLSANANASNFQSPQIECPESLNGFTSLGDFEGHRYFLSDFNANPADARNIAASNGGYITVINSQEENDFIQQNIPEIIHIGLNDAEVEGSLLWEDGSLPDFQNFGSCNFCYENNESLDFVIMHHWDGTWSFNHYQSERRFVLEIPCDDEPVQSNCSFIVQHQIDLGENFLRETNMQETADGFNAGIGSFNPATQQYNYTSLSLNTAGGLTGQTNNVLPNLFLDTSKEFYYDFEIVGTTIVLKKLSLAGTLQWENSIALNAPDAIISVLEAGFNIKEIADKILLTGNYQIDNGDSFKSFLLQTDLAGNATAQQFYDTYSGLVESRTLSVLDAVPGGGFYLSSVSSSMGDISKYLVKTDADGNEIWSVFLAAYPGQDIAHYAGQTSDGSGIYFRFSVDGFPATPEPSPASIKKFDSIDGSESWAFLPESFLQDSLPAFPVQIIRGATVTEDDGLVFDFSAFKENTAYHFAARLDASGNLTWTTDLPENLGNFAAALSASDGGFVFQNIQTDKAGFFKINMEGKFTPLCTEEQLPDLTVRNLQGWNTSANQLTSGTSVDISFDIHNNGVQTASADSGYILNLYLQQVDASPYYNILVQQYPFNNTPFGVTPNNSITFTIPDMPSGVYELVLEIDGADVVTEFNEYNNLLTSGVTRDINILAPELSLAVLCPDSFPQHGQNISWPVEITNNGTTTSLSDFVILWSIPVDEDGVATPLIDIEIPAIAPGESHSTSIEYTMPINSREFPGYQDFANYAIVTNFYNGDQFDFPTNADATDFYCKKSNADIAINIEPQSTTFDDSHLVSYDIMVTNNGPETAYNVICNYGSFLFNNIQNESVSNGTTWIDTNSNNGLQSFVWALDNLAPGATETLTITNQNLAGGFPDSVFTTIHAHASSGHSTETNLADNEAAFTFTFDGISPNCDTTIPGFTFLGAWNGHHYFIADQKENWETAQGIALSHGGYLASLATPEEGDFLLGHLNEIVLIGGKDANCDGTFEWADGTYSAYSNNSYTCNSTSIHTNMNFWNGELAFDNQWVERKFIMEIECAENRIIRTNKSAAATAIKTGVYPNPANNHLFVNLETGNNASILLQIFDAAGRLVQSNPFAIASGSNKIRLALDELEGGIYFIKITDQNGNRNFETKRFVKQG